MKPKNVPIEIHSSKCNRRNTRIKIKAKFSENKPIKNPMNRKKQLEIKYLAQTNNNSRKDLVSPKKNP